MNEKIHFISGDKRFCGTKKQYRRFSTRLNEITCPKCEDNIGLKITKQGKDYLNSIGYNTNIK